MKKTIEKIAIKSCREFSQYFQGYGVSYTDWTDCFVGYGKTVDDAKEDALNQLAEEYRLHEDGADEVKDFMVKCNLIGFAEEIPEENEDEYFYLAIFAKEKEIGTMPPHFIGSAKVEDHFGAILVTFEDGKDILFQGDDMTSFLESCWPPHCESADDVEGVLDDYYSLAVEAAE